MTMGGVAERELRGESRTAYLRLVRSVEALASEALSAFRNDVLSRPSVGERELVGDGRLYVKFVLSLALAARRGGAAVGDAASAFAALRAWSREPATDARHAMPNVIVGGADVILFERVEAAVRAELTATMFGGEPMFWQTVSAADLHEALMWLFEARFVQVGSLVRIVANRVNTRVTRSASRYAVNATIGRAFEDPRNAPNPANCFVASPQCRAGNLLVASLVAMRRELARTQPIGAFDDSALCAWARSNLRAADEMTLPREFARLGVWLETGTTLSSDDLYAIVGARFDRDAAWSELPEHARTFVFADVTRSPLVDPLAVVADASRAGDRVGVLADSWITASVDLADARNAWDSMFDTDRPIAEPMLDSRFEYGRTLAIVATRRADRSGSPFAWTVSLEGASLAENRLFRNFSNYRRLDKVAASPPATDASAASGASWPRVMVRSTVVPLDAVLSPVATGDGWLQLVATERGWDGFALYALLRSTLVRWQHWMLSRSRGATNAIDPQELFELVAPLALDPSKLRECGAMLAAARTPREVRAAIDEIDRIVGATVSMDDDARALLEDWRRAAPWPEPMVDNEKQPEARPAPPGLPPLAPNLEGGSSVSAHSDGAPSVRHTKSNGVLGQGSESMLRRRGDDRRSPVIPTRKAMVTQPEGDAEREAFAILRAAGPEGLSLRALVRRAREHEEDEIREAISRLITDAWIVSEGEGDASLLRVAPRS